MGTILYSHLNIKVAIDHKLIRSPCYYKNLSKIRGAIAHIHPEGAIDTISSVCLPDEKDKEENYLRARQFRGMYTVQYLGPDSAMKIFNFTS